MNLDRLNNGEKIAGASAILLFLFMFFDWFGVDINQGQVGGELNLFDHGGNAWQTLEVIPLFLMLTIVFAVGSALLRLGRSNWQPTVPPAAAVFVGGALAAILILIRIVSPPGPSGSIGGDSFEPTLKVGIFLALAAALGIAYGGYRAMREEGFSFGDLL